MFQRTYPYSVDIGCNIPRIWSSAHQRFPSPPTPSLFCRLEESQSNFRSYETPATSLSLATASYIWYDVLERHCERTGCERGNPTRSRLQQRRVEAELTAEATAVAAVVVYLLLRDSVIIVLSCIIEVYRVFGER